MILARARSIQQVTSHEQATVDGPDVICSLALYLMKSLQKFGKSTELQGRALDLSSAYRQLPIKDDSRKFGFLAIYNPETQSSSLFQQVALPFGSKSAVHAFIRCARFLVGCRQMPGTAHVMLLRRFCLLCNTCPFQKYSGFALFDVGHFWMGLRQSGAQK